MVKTLSILAILLLVSCDPHKRIQRIVERNPHLMVYDTITVHDTIIQPTVMYDTTTVIVPHKTVEVINNEHVRLQYIYDTITNTIHHDVECKGDTIIKIHEIPVETIRVEENPPGIEWKFWALLGFVTLVVVAYIWKGR